jgi:O-antigen/teichoic acid export membrane protein
VSKSRHAIVWSVLNALGTRGTNFIVYLFLARLLGPEGFGIFALGMAAIGFLEIVCEHKFQPILIQRQSLSPADTASVFYFQLGLGAVAALALCLGAPALGRLFGEPQLTEIVPWLAIALFINTSTYVHEALLKRELQFKTLTLRSMAANVFGGAVGVVLAFAGFGVHSMAIMTLTSAIAGAVVLWRTSPWRPRAGWSGEAFLPLHRSARVLAGTSIAGAVVTHANTFLVGYVYGAAVAGLYAFVLRIYDVLMRVTTFSLSDAAFPIFARKVGDLKDFRATFESLLGSAGTMTVGLLMIVGAAAPVLIPLCFGERWSGASDYLVIYMLTGAVISVGAYNDVTLLAFGRTRQMAATQLLGFLIWVGMLPLLKVFGPIFPAVAWCLKEAVVFPIKAHWALGLMEMPARTYLKRMAAVVGAGVAACAAVFATQQFLNAPRLPVLLTSVAVGAAVFGVVTVLAGGSLGAMLSRFSLLVRRR